MTNSDKEKVYIKRKILRILIIVFGLATLVLSIWSLVDKVTPIPALICFLIEAILSKYREKLSYNEKESK